ncbi:MAG TPA: aldo/keto reductase [Candidatus Fimiplasma intestinipullorum]|uniref:Aldo/keto reductase n=1 Tax=Candidatus Fimiplasma intestinipullorum TaxID=2840825 RepID=A0A9D1HLG6_9FIRM|nr:aldo/keto reductase [Candidatus Fimiplasma intestinipullorum]
MLSNSKLGYGLMRLPKDNIGDIDLTQIQYMVDSFMKTGFNYFDTAYVYGGVRLQ